MARERERESELSGLYYGDFFLEPGSFCARKERGIVNGRGVLDEEGRRKASASSRYSLGHPGMTCTIENNDLYPDDLGYTCWELYWKDYLRS